MRIASAGAFMKNNVCAELDVSYEALVMNGTRSALGQSLTASPDC